jgi:hypothetical protein
MVANPVEIKLLENGDYYINLNHGAACAGLVVAGVHGDKRSEELI